MRERCLSNFYQSSATRLTAILLRQLSQRCAMDMHACMHVCTYYDNKLACIFTILLSHHLAHQEGKKARRAVWSYTCRLLSTCSCGNYTLVCYHAWSALASFYQLYPCPAKFQLRLVGRPNIIIGRPT